VTEHEPSVPGLKGKAVKGVILERKNLNWQQGLIVLTEESEISAIWHWEASLPDWKGKIV
jgi:hypothetical protein